MHWPRKIHTREMLTKETHAAEKFPTARNTEARLPAAVRENEPAVTPPKERLDACDFLCWFQPIMLTPADFRLARIVA